MSMNNKCINDCDNGSCGSKSCENKTNSSYIKRIIRLIGPVILGSKPAEIVNIPGGAEDKERKLKEIKEFFEGCKKVKYEINCYLLNVYFVYTLFILEIYPSIFCVNIF